MANSPTLNELIAAIKVSADAIQAEASRVEIVNQIISAPVKLGIVSPADAAENTKLIRQTVARYGRFDFDPGLVMIDNDIRVASGNQFHGLGNPSNPSVIKVVPKSPAIAARNAAKAWYSIFQSNTDPGSLAGLVGNTFGLPVGPAHGVTIRNLTLDAGYDEQQASISGSFLTTTEAVSLCGTGLVMEDCILRNVAKGLSGGECFAVRVFAPGNGRCIEARPSRLSRISCDHVGSAVSTHPGAGGDEITLLSIVGSADNTVTAPVIQDCLIRGLKRSPQQPSPIHCLHTAYAYGADVRNNTVLDCDGVGYYQDTGTNLNFRLRGNLFRNVHRGVFLNAITDFGFADFEIVDNVLSTYAYRPTWNVSSTPASILFQKISPGGIGLVGGLIARNRISGQIGDLGTQHFYPRGLYLEIRNGKDVQDLVFRDNQLDILQPPASPYYPVGWKGVLSIYATQSGWTADSLRAWNNRDVKGFLPPITLVDSGYIPKLAISQL